MTIFIIVLCLIFALGFLAQYTGLCMVRGVNEWKNGNPSFLLAIIFSGVLSWVAVVTAFILELPLQFKVYEPSVLFAIGGVLFGLGSAINNGCGISTLTRLSKGEFAYSFTIVGWLIGWSILATWRPDVSVIALPLPTNVTYGALIIISLTISFWVAFGNNARKKVWFGMMGIGLLSGFIFLYQPKWAPSALLHDLSDVITGQDNAIWPDLTRYLLFIALLIGMFFSAWKAKRYFIVLPHIKYWLIHLLSGVLMGIGASLAMGGNSFQLLMALPVFSVAGIIAILGIIVGIFVGVDIKRKYL